MAHTLPPITILVGQVTEITDRHLVLAPGTRVVLPQEQSGITAGMTVRVRPRARVASDTWQLVINTGTTSSRS